MLVGFFVIIHVVLFFSNAAALPSSTLHHRHPPPLSNAKKRRPNQGVDHTLFAKAVGTIKFTRHAESIPGRPRRDVKRVSILPLLGDYSGSYAAKASAMVAARNEHRRRMLGLRAKYG